MRLSPSSTDAFVRWLNERLNNNMDELLDILESIFDELKANISKIIFEADNIQHIISVSLYGTILENCSSCILLFKKKHFTSIPILTRNMFEALIDLMNAINDPNYYKYMNVANLVQKRKILRHIIDNYESQNISIPQIGIQDFREEFENIRRKINQLKDDGYEKLSILDRFNRADLDELYPSLYNILCQESHNNLSVLEKRHFEKVGEDYKIIYFKDWPISDKVQVFHFVTAILVLSMKYTSLLFRLTAERYIEKVIILFEEFKLKEQQLLQNNQ